MKKRFLMMLALASALVLTGCGSGGGGDEQLALASNDLTIEANAANKDLVVNAFATEQFVFADGINEFNTNNTTTIVINGPASAPTFSLAQAGGNTASGDLLFGSCTFVVRTSTYPAGHPLAAGSTVTFNQCRFVVSTRGVPASGLPTERSVRWFLNNNVGTGTVTVVINRGGQVTINGVAAGTVTLVAATGGTFQ